MASHLDLEEQEQLDQLKHFWNRYGNAITWVLIVIFGGFAAWNGYQYWQRTQAAQASALYDELDRAVQAKDLEKTQRVFDDIRSKFGRTSYAAQGGLLAAQTLFEKGKAEEAKAALNWVADQSGDEGLQAVARLRVAALQLDAKAYDEAMKTLSASFPAEFDALVADRKGDVLEAQGKTDEAVAQYQIAYKKLDDRSEYRRMVEVKLNALGVNPREPAATAASNTEDKK